MLGHKKFPPLSLSFLSILIQSWIMTKTFTEASLHPSKESFLTVHNGTLDWLVDDAFFSALKKCVPLGFKYAARSNQISSVRPSKFTPRSLQFSFGIFSPSANSEEREREKKGHNGRELKMRTHCCPCVLHWRKDIFPANFSFISLPRSVIRAKSPFSSSSA